MPENKYRLVFLSILDGFDIETITAKLAQLTKTPPRKLSFLSDDKPVTIKRNLDYETASRHLKMLEEIGLHCRIEPPDEPSVDKPKPAYTDDGICYIDNKNPPLDSGENSNKLTQKEIDNLIQEMQKKSK